MDHDHDLEADMSTTETALTPYTELAEEVREGDIELSDLLSRLGHEPEPTDAKIEIALPKSITKEQRAALERLSEVFAQVVPAERRTLEPSEVQVLMVERNTLDEIEKMASSRKNDIRTTVFNHLDVEYEDEHADEDGELRDDVHRDGSGHYTVKGDVPVPDEGKRFTREVREGKSSISAEKLEALLDDPDFQAELEDADVVYDRATFNKMTRQTRVFDEHKMMLLLRKRPELLPVVAKAVSTGTPVNSFHVRKMK